MGGPGLILFFVQSLEFQFHQAGGGQKVNLQALHQMLNGHALVGAVHGAAAGGPGFLRLFNAKAHGIGEMARIGAAAHGEGLFILAGHLVVSVHQRADGRAAGFDIERLHGLHGLEAAAVLGGESADFGEHLFVGDAGGVTDVDVLHKAAFLQGNGAADARQRAEHIVTAGNADAGTVRGGKQSVQHFQRAVFAFAAQPVLQQILHHQGNGVYGALRHRGVPADAVPGDAHKAVARGLYRHALCAGKHGNVRFHQCAGFIGHYVSGHAALKFHQIA
jgi:hypothetical protein